LPVDDCIYGVITREREKEFPCFLPVNDELIEDVKKYNSVCKPIVLSLFEKYPDKKVVTFISHTQIDEYITKLEVEYGFNS